MRSSCLGRHPAMRHGDVEIWRDGRQPLAIGSSRRSAARRRSCGRRGGRSRSRASRATPASNGSTKVRTGWRRTGGVAITLSSWMPASAACRVRGIGVAVMVSTCTPCRSRCSAALWRVPKRCSSSMITRARSLKRSCGDSSAWVPTTIRTEPSASPWRTACASLARPSRDSCSTRTSKPGEAAAEGLQVLADQQGGRRQQRDLAAAQRGRGGRPQRHLGLAEADIAADQAVHRRRAAREIGERGLDRAGLVLARRGTGSGARSARRRRAAASGQGPATPPARGTDG